MSKNVRKSFGQLNIVTSLTKEKKLPFFSQMKLVRLYQISRQEISAGNYDNYKTRCFPGNNIKLPTNYVAS